MEIPRGRGVSKALFFEGKYHTKMEFPEKWGTSNYKTFRGWGMDIFWNNTLILMFNFMLKFVLAGSQMVVTVLL